MSRIDEALRQAGLRSNTSAPSDASPAGLDSFPAGPESDIAEPARDAGTQAHAIPPVQERSRRSSAPSVSSAGTAAAGIRPANTAGDARVLTIEKLILHEQTGRACIEQYRRVASMLHQLQEERGIKVLMVASAQPGEGKTLTAANLALTLSESYRRRVLLIDADLRRPSLNALFRLPPSPTGLSERLKGEGRSSLRVQELSDYLALLPGGKPDPDPMAGLTSGRMQQIIEQGAADYDWVILDTPPIGLQSDAHLLAAMVEATILVIGAGSTPAAAVQHAVETIGREKIVGVVLNRVEQNTFNEAAYYGYYATQPLQGGKGIELSQAAGS